MDESVEKAISNGGENYLRAAKNVYDMESGYLFMHKFKVMQAEIDARKWAEEAKKQYREYMYDETTLPYMDKKCRELFK